MLRVPVKVVALTEPPTVVLFTTERVPKFPEEALILPADTAPVTPRLLKVPSEVILGWAAVVRVMAPLIAVKIGFQPVLPVPVSFMYAQVPAPPSGRR